MRIPIKSEKNYCVRYRLVDCNIEIESEVWYRIVWPQRRFDLHLPNVGNWNHGCAPKCCARAMASAQG